MAVNFEYYRIFYYVAKYRSMTQAAAALMSSQPNVTRVINNLENELGCRLIIRNNRGITLTAEGEQLYKHAAIAFEQLQRGEAELSQNAGLQSGILYIGASETALHGLLLPILRQFHEAYPAVRLKIFNYTTPQAINALKSGQIDFAVVTSPTKVSGSLQEIKLKTIHEILIASSSFTSLAYKKLHLKELTQYPLISLAQNTRTYELYNKFYLDHGLAWEPDIEVATSDLILPMVKNSLGLGFIPAEFAQEALSKGEIIEIQLVEKTLDRTICLIQDTHHGLSIAARAMRDLLVEQVK